MISKGKIVARLVLAAIIGGIIGAEREVSNRPAGLRTHILVSAGSALVMLISIDGFCDSGKPLGDPARLAAQVVSGIGFLGAGTIMRTENDIKGLTTAASLWVCAGIGLAIGNGYYLGGLLTTVIVLVTLASLRFFEEKVRIKGYKTLEIISSNSQGVIGRIIDILDKYNVSIKNISINSEIKEEIETSTKKINFKIKIPSSNIDLDNFIDEIYQIADIDKIVFDDQNMLYNYYNFDGITKNKN